MHQHNSRRSKETCVRAWSPSNERYPNRTLEEAEQLEREGLVTAIRNRKGVIRNIRFFGEIAPSFWNRYKPGTRYSFQEQCAGGRKVWTHRKLPSVPVDCGLSEGEIVQHRDVAQRAVFAGVTLSIQAPEPPSHSVTFIAEFPNPEHEIQAEEFAQAA